MKRYGYLLHSKEMSEEIITKEYAEKALSK